MADYGEGNEIISFTSDQEQFLDKPMLFLDQKKEWACLKSGIYGFSRFAERLEM